MYRRLLALGALVAFLLVGATASAQTPTIGTLVSNTGQTDSWQFAFNQDWALPFATGSHSAGYTLTSVEIAGGLTTPSGSTPATYTVSIHTGSGTSVGSSVGTLTSSDISAGTNTFSSSDGIELDADTSYFVVLDIAGVSGGKGNRGAWFRSTASLNEDSGGAGGWTIGNKMTVRGTGDTPWVLAGGVNVIEMHIKGYANTASTPASETLLTNAPDTDGSSGGACQNRALRFGTGPADATLAGVRVRANNAGLDVEIREDSGGNPSSSTLYQLTGGSLAANVVTLSAPANATLSANTHYWLVIATGSTGTCQWETSRAFTTLHGWSAGGFKWWNGSAWLANQGTFTLEITARVHPESDAEETSTRTSNYVYKPLPRCTEEQRQMRQRGREDPPACSGGFYHHWEIYPSSDPCDQPWEVPGSYRHDRGCLSRY